jgi:hypothetical protein
MSWFVPATVLSLAEAGGIGRKACAAVGFAVSEGGAWRTDFGMEAIGCEWRTSLCHSVSQRDRFQCPKVTTYPASIRVKEPPPDSVCSNNFHTAASVQKDGQHPFAEVDNLLVLLRIRRVRSIVCHRVLLGYRGDDESGMESGQCVPEGSELRVSTSNFQVASPNSVNDVSTTALQALPRIRYDDGKRGVLVEDLLYTAFVATGLSLGGGRFRILLSVVRFVVAATDGCDGGN